MQAEFNSTTMEDPYQFPLDNIGISGHNMGRDTTAQCPKAAEKSQDQISHGMKTVIGKK